MTRYRSAARICRANGWTVGDVLEGDEGYGPDRIRITAIGKAAILARLVQYHGEPCRGAAEGTWDLSLRQWRQVKS